MRSHLGLNAIRTLHLVSVSLWQGLPFLCQYANLKNGDFNEHKKQPVLFEYFGICHILYAEEKGVDYPFQKYLTHLEEEVELWASFHIEDSFMGTL